MWKTWPKNNRIACAVVGVLFLALGVVSYLEWPNSVDWEGLLRSGDVGLWWLPAWLCTIGLISISQGAFPKYDRALGGAIALLVAAMFVIVLAEVPSPF